MFDLKKFCVIAGAALTFSAPAEAFTEYDCGVTNGFSVSVTWWDEEDFVEAVITQLSTGMTEAARFDPLPSSGGTTRFGSASPAMEFVVAGGNAAYLMDTFSMQQIPCVYLRSVAPGTPTPPVSGYGAPYAAFSYGGNLRAGPGMNYADVGGTREGQPITLLRETGVWMNDYMWYEVQLASGQIAYQWGGIICARGTTAPGTFTNC